MLNHIKLLTFLKDLVYAKTNCKTITLFPEFETNYFEKQSQAAKMLNAIWTHFKYQKLATYYS